MGWLPAPSAAPSVQRRRWQPATADSLGIDLGRCSYLVVDEIVGDSTGLVLSEWPDVDERGRLRFDGMPKMLGAHYSALQSFLDEHRRPGATAERPIRIGDVFAVRVITGALEEVAEELAATKRLEPLLDPSTWIEPPIYDVSADARDAAKTAFYAAVTTILGPDEAAELADLAGGPAS